MKWTTAADIKTQLKRHWQRGELCRSAAGKSDLLPLKIAFRQPSAKVMLDEFSAMQDWVKVITSFAQKHAVALTWRELKHRSLGRQYLPCTLVFETPEQAAVLIGKRQSLQLFCKLYRATLSACPKLQSWLLKRPLKVLELEPVWFRLVDLCLWIQTHPNPGVYLRQVSLAGIDSKLIESHRSVLAELFDLTLPACAINDDFSGVAGFARRYGFLDKPLMLRLRPLDTNIQLLHVEGCQDVAMTAQAFGHLQKKNQSQIKRVFIVENEINYLAFPALADAIVIFGSGYGFDALKQAKWLNGCQLYYWGDLDTHGFAILNQLRAFFPQVQSLLMDRQTLLSHKPAWGIEPKQEKKNLTHLFHKEAELYDDLRSNKLSGQLRLEQECVAFDDVMEVIKKL